MCEDKGRWCSFTVGFHILCYFLFVFIVLGGNKQYCYVIFSYFLILILEKKNTPQDEYPQQTHIPIQARQDFFSLTGSGRIEAP